MSSVEAQDWSRRPIDEHYRSLRGYDLISSFETKGKLVDAIAVVANFTEIKSTRGTDYSRSLIVCDPSAALSTTGLMVQFYKPEIAELPCPAEGSIIVLKQFKLFDYRGVFQAWSNYNSSWIIYDANGHNILSKSDKYVTVPDGQVHAYIARLAGWWKTRNGLSATTVVANPANLNSVSSHTTGRTTILLKDLREHQFCDVYGYVVKTFPSRDNAFTIYLTDYTPNSNFHDYVYGESKWKGPYGCFTVQITLWDSHAYYAREHVHDDQYVLLRNVQGKKGDSGRLEGAVRGDRQNPDKINVVVMTAQDPRVKPIKLRRAQYEATWRVQKERLDEESIMQHQAEKAIQLTPPPSINPNLSTSYAQVPVTAIGDILEPPYVPQADRVEGPGGRRQPHRFRTVARIIDFWPTDLRDFSRPFCMSCQASYTPVNPDRERDINDSSAGRCTICNTEKDKDDPDTYEFCFSLLIEGQDHVCLPLIFSGDDVETLLGEEIVACDLYLPENVTMLTRLREKMFLLWGNLEESFSAPPPPRKKAKHGKNDLLTNNKEPILMWNEMCVMEYWVNMAAGQAGWNGRRFKGFGMTIL